MATSKKKTSAGNKSDKPAKSRKTATSKKAQTKAAPKAAAKTARASKSASKTKKDASGDSPIKAIVEAKARSKNKAGKNAKKSSVATFTMDDVREAIKQRHASGNNTAKKSPAKAATKTAPAPKKAPVVEEVPQPQRVLGAATLADILGFGAAASPTSAPTSGKKIERPVPAKYRKYYDLLKELRDSITSNMSRRKQDTAGKSSSAEPTLPPQNSEDDTFDHDFALSLVANEQEGLAEIDAAIDRIYEGSYGVCEITGEPISHERLEAVPFTRYSVSGQAQYESMKRRRNQRSNTFMDSSEDAGNYSTDDADE